MHIHKWDWAQVLLCDLYEPANVIQSLMSAEYCIKRKFRSHAHFWRCLSGEKERLNAPMDTITWFARNAHTHDTSKNIPTPTAPHAERPSGEKKKRIGKAVLLAYMRALWQTPHSQTKPKCSLRKSFTKINFDLAENKLRNGRRKSSD